MRNEPPPSHPSHYAIRIKGLPDPHWEWLAGLTVTYIEPDETLLSGPMVDQAALHGLLARIRDLNLTLLSVNQIDSRERKNVMDKVKSDIPRDVALQLCAEIRQQYRGKWWTIPGMWCMGCTLASKGDLAKMCVSGTPGYRGCGLVNARYDSRAKIT